MLKDDFGGTALQRCVKALSLKREATSIGVANSTESEQTLRELFRGQRAHADPVACIEDLSFELAKRRVESFPHSIGNSSST